MNTDGHTYGGRLTAVLRLQRWLYLSALIGVCLFLTSCGSTPTDMRTLVPADTLVYLETNDLGTALEPFIADEDPSKKLHASSLKGVQLAIAVTGIESSEQKLGEGQSNAQIKPNFVAVADTRTWHFYAVRFAEQELGAFVQSVYGGKPSIEEPEHPGGGRDIIWTAADGRKAYAFVLGSVVYFSNDRGSLDKALAIRNGASSLASTGKVQPAGADAVASGYASSQGISEIADVAGLRTAATAGDDPKVRSAVATILPQLIREMVTEVTWSEKHSDTVVTDTYQFKMPGNVAAALKDTQASDLRERLRNTVIGLLADSELDDKSRAAVADAIADGLNGTGGAQTQFTPTGMERTTTSRTGLIGVIANVLATSSSPPA